MQVHVTKPELVEPVKGCAQTTVCIKMAEKIQVIEKKSKNPKREPRRDHELLIQKWLGLLCKVKVKCCLFFF